MANTVERQRRSTDRAIRVPHRVDIDLGSREADYISSTGKRIPVYDRYRYRTKLGWWFFPVFRDLVEVRDRGWLNVGERQFLEGALGKRTLGNSVEEGDEILRAVAMRSPKAFLWGLDRAVSLKPTAGATQSRVDLFVWRRALRLRDLGIEAPRGRAPKRMLEIGFTSGGHSLAAFERLGYNATGVDNYYDSLMAERTIPEFILRDQLKSSVRLVIGDIADPCLFEGETFDLVFSESVLEHLVDLRASLSQMRRLLSPTGVMVHLYGPYYSEQGGHSPGTMDVPFGHVTMPVEEQVRYIETLRPFEAPTTVPWVKASLNRQSLSQIQRAFHDAGSSIIAWQTWIVTPPTLTASLVEECLDANPGIAIDDLVTPLVAIVAR